jgi:hypothetical protein
MSHKLEGKLLKDKDQPAGGLMHALTQKHAHMRLR